MFTAALFTTAGTGPPTMKWVRKVYHEQTEEPFSGKGLRGKMREGVHRGPDQLADIFLIDF